MSDICNFIPDDPSCQPEPEPVPAGGDEKMMDDDMDMDMDESMEKEMMKAQIAYLMIPLMIIVQNAAW